MESMTELDATRIPTATRHAEIFRKFDQLQSGEALVLLNDHDPKPLLYQFQFERAGRFDWHRLEAGPGRFRVLIQRRRDETARSPGEYLAEDHLRMDGLLAEVDELVKNGASDAAARRFAELSRGMEDHITAEEEVLFPAFERAGGPQGPVQVMRTEHVEIRRNLRAVADVLAVPSAPRYLDASRGLKSFLAAHNMKEERILYPTADRAIADRREQEDLVRRIQAI